MFNKEKFHNQLALSLGYERLVNDKKITISIEELEVPWVTLKVQGLENIRFRASEKIDVINLKTSSDMCYEIKKIADVVHQAYLISCKELFRP